jgi:hypothetical protein
MGVVTGCVSDSRVLELVDVHPDPLVDVWLLRRDAAELRTEVGHRVGTGISRVQRAQDAAGIPYRRSCP